MPGFCHAGVTILTVNPHLSRMEGMGKRNGLFRFVSDSVALRAGDIIGDHKGTESNKDDDWQTDLEKIVKKGFVHRLYLRS